jgi:hypothetical protein
MTASRIRQLFAIAILCCCARGTASSQAARIVTTIAGNGLPGARDGAGANAEFYAPSALAAARDGTLFVADSFGQRIRTVRPDGRVTTLAGGGAPDRSGLAVAGAYADGPAASARFNRPSGIALGPDGAVYVADTLNHCVRRIERGKVTTYAGTPSSSTHADGPRALARFAFPQALTFDGDGNLYVADFGVGIREIARDGTVSTLATPDAPLIYSGLSAIGRGAAMTLYAADLFGIGVYRASTKTWTFSNSVDGDGPFGSPYGIAAVDERFAVFTDPKSQSVRVFRAPTDHQNAFTRSIAGSTADDAAESTGYRDGPVTSARFFAPSGIAIRNGALVIADAGNRRIRTLPLPSLREPLSAQSPITTPKRFYRIVLVTNAWALGPSLWDDSIGGTLERNLARAGAGAGLTRPLHVDVVRLDTATTSETSEYVRTALANGAADLVIFDVDIMHVNRDIVATPALEAGDAWAPALTANIVATADALRASHTAFLVVVQPLPIDASPSEGLFQKSTSSAPEATYAAWLHYADELSSAVRDAHVPTLDLSTAVHAYEAGPAPVPLAPSIGDAFAGAGERFIGEAIAREIERTRPWSQAAYGVDQGRNFSK